MAGSDRQADESINHTCSKRSKVVTYNGYWVTFIPVSPVATDAASFGHDMEFLELAKSTRHSFGLRRGERTDFVGGKIENELKV